MLRVGNVYGPFSDWVRSAHGIAFITDSRKRRLDITSSSIHQVYLDFSGLFVIAFTSAKGPRGSCTADRSRAGGSHPSGTGSA